MRKKEMMERIERLEEQMLSLRTELAKNRVIIKRRIFGAPDYPIYLPELENKVTLLYDHLKLEMACVPSRTFLKSIARAKETGKK